jgi:hypothetical protein
MCWWMCNVNRFCSRAVYLLCTGSHSLPAMCQLTLIPDVKNPYPQKLCGKRAILDTDLKMTYPSSDATHIKTR